MEKKLIVHILMGTVLHSESYIDFFLNYQTDYEHVFFLTPQNEEFINLGLKRSGVVIENIRTPFDIYKLRIGSYLKKSYKIVVSGFFSYKNLFLILRKGLLKKTYIHFWGGDYCLFRDYPNDKIARIKKRFLNFCLRNGASVINLIDGEYDVLSQIFNIECKNFVAAFPYCPQEKDFNILEYYEDIRKNTSQEYNKVIVGNSATINNHHIEVFEKIKNFKNIEVYCPLSYGDNDYRDRVIMVGKDLFGDRFHPLLELMDYDSYLRFLATCSVGIFNVDRQQALGNINRLIQFGKKIFIRNDSPMWKYFNNAGVTVFDINSLPNLEEEDFLSTSSFNPMENITNLNKRLDITTVNNQWTSVLKW